MITSCDEKNKMTIDLHNMNMLEAWSYIDNCVNFAPSNIKEIVVIHGYNSGKNILNMVRKEYKNNKVLRKYLSLNNGITSLILY